MKINDFKAELLEKAIKAGFADCEVYFQDGNSFEVMVYEGEISQYEISSQRGVSFRGTYDGNMGYSYSEEISEDVIDFLLEEAKQNAQVIEEAEKEELYFEKENYPIIEGYKNELSKVSEIEKINAAKIMEETTKFYDEKIKSVDYCLVSYGEGYVSINNSKGLELEYKDNASSAYVSAIAQSGESIKTASDFWIGTDWSKFNPEEVGKNAAKDVISHLDAIEIKSGKYKIVLKNEVMSDLLATFASVFFGENVQKGFSLLNNKEGEKIASEKVTIRDDGIYEEGQSSVPFDSEGVSSKNKIVVENGVLKTFLYNLKSAKKAGVHSTGNGFKFSYKSPVQTACTNFYLEKGSLSEEDIFKSVKDGILITEIAGLHSGANTISGDFSLSAEGFLIEDGKVSKPIEQITIAGNFYDLLKSIEIVGDNLKFNMPRSLGSMGSPTVFVGELSVSGL